MLLPRKGTALAVIACIALGTAAVGAVLTPVGAAPAAVLISDALWRRTFAADPGVTGRARVTAERALTIVGVMPGFVLRASLAPARRAARVQPLVALRGD